MIEINGKIRCTREGRHRLDVGAQSHVLVRVHAARGVIVFKGAKAGVNAGFPVGQDRGRGGLDKVDGVRSTDRWRHAAASVGCMGRKSTSTAESVETVAVSAKQHSDAPFIVVS